MNLLISKQDVVNMAFVPSEQMRAELVPQAAIAEAQYKFIKPVLNGLYDQLLADAHSELCELYVKPALAYYVKYLIITQHSGYLNLMQSASAQAALAVADRLRTETLARASTLLNLCVSIIEASPQDYPEYDRTKNVRNRTKIVGGLVI